MYRGEYSLIGSELSMFTRKLEAQLCFQKIPFKWRMKTAADTEAIQQRGGTRFIPLLETPDGWMIHDTIAVGPMLSDRFNEVPVIPATPTLRTLCFVLEDYYNHWLPRHALHSRWCYEDNVKVAGRGFGMNIVLGKSIEADLSAEEEKQVAEMGSFMRDSFGLFACGVQGAGVDQKEAVTADFQVMMTQLASHFKEHAFLLGDRPCLADFALAGTAKAHFLIDPEPRSWLKENESMLEDYVARVFNSDHNGLNWNEGDKIPETLLPILEHAIKNYQAFALNSIKAAANGEKEFKLDLGYGEFTARSMKRLDKSRLHVQDEINRCNGWETELKDLGILGLYEHPAFIK